MNTLKNKFLLLFIIFFAMIVNGQTKHLITPEDVVTIRAVSNPQISPDGKWVVFEVLEPSDINNPALPRNKNIWLVPTDGSTEPRKYIFSPQVDYQPQWSSDGKYLAFLSLRGKEKKIQIYLLNREDEKIEAITNVKQGVESFQWIPNSEDIAFTAKESLTLEEEKKVENFDDEIIIGKDYRITNLYEINIKTHKVKQITKNLGNVNAFDYSHKSNKIVLNISPTPQKDDVSYHSKLIIINRDGSNRIEVSGFDNGFDLSRSIKNSYWSPDDKQIIYFIRIANSYLPAVVSTENWKARVLADKYKGTVWYMNWNPKTQEILVSSQQGVQGIFAKLDIKTNEVLPIQKVGTSYCEIQTWSISDDGNWVVFHSASDTLPDDIWIMNTGGSNLRRLTNMNPQIKSAITGMQEIINWKNEEGITVEGLLLKPADYDSLKTYPTIVEIHGGPTWAWWNGWLSDWLVKGHLLTSKGFVVLLPNPRGSNGYGLEFTKANFNAWGDSDFEDIMSGVDYLIEQGISDSTRLGIEGWSYGGFMTAMAVTQTNRFKAAVMGASVTNITTMRSTSRRPEYFDLFFNGKPIDREMVYRNHSPITFVKNTSTPTLIFHGENDKVVPITQSYEFYQALIDLGVTTEYIVYPRETHSINERKHQLDLMNRTIEWFSYYLK